MIYKIKMLGNATVEVEYLNTDSVVEISLKHPNGDVDLKFGINQAEDLIDALQFAVNDHYNLTE